MSPLLAYAPLVAGPGTAASLARDTFGNTF
jgi:hypothetical protein